MIIATAIVAMVTVAAGILVSMLLSEKVAPSVMSWFLAAFGVVTVVLGLMGLESPTTFQLSEPFYLGLAPVSFRLDGLSAVFVLLLGVVTFSVSIYIPGYLRSYKSDIKSGFFFLNLFLFVSSMVSVLLAENALTFLVAWEIMSLSSALLVAFDMKSKASKRATVIYLAATRLATSFLAIGFVILGTHFGSWSFSSWNIDSPTLYIPATVILLGFCIKAGLWPFHIWLPYAHTSAPAPVSALMSGVMLKIAIYAIIRIFLIGSPMPLFLSVLLLVLGMISSIWGVLFALVQNDIKRVLGYSSVENIGIIAMAVAVCMYAKTCQHTAIVDLALVAALFYCINHGLFKALLFLSVGSVDAAIHNRTLSSLGGLGLYMPYTMILFVVGSAAICALPPLNGFASKWLIYQSLFLTICQSLNQVTGVLFVFAVGCLALASGLTIACFTRVIGACFLGRPRTEVVKHGREATLPMLVSQALLAFLCLLCGVFSPYVTDWLAKAFKGSSSQIVSIPSLPLGLVLVSSVFLFLILFLAIRHGRKVRLVDSWECGYGNFSERMQISADSFVQPVASLFHPVLLYRMRSDISGVDRRHFPDKIRSESTMKSLLENSFYRPVISLLLFSGRHIARLQAGSVHMYLLYVLFSLIGLLILGATL